MDKRILVIGATIGWLCLFAPPAPADTVRLKDGTLYEGTIQKESDTDIEIEVENASGTIFHTETIKKSDVAEVTRPTPEQRAEKEMQEAYKQTLKYQLDPQFSQTVTYYDQVIGGVFQKFLAKYPGSPHEKDINERVAQWTEERDKVSAGMGRIGTEWLPAAEVAKRTEDTRAQMMLEKGRQLASQGQFAAALDQFRAILGVTHRTALVDDARKNYGEVGKMWSESLERTRETVNSQIAPTEATLTRLRGELTTAQANLHTADQNPTDLSDRRLAQDVAASRYRLEVSNLQGAYQTADNNLTDLRQQLVDLDRRISAVKTMTSTASALVAPGEAPPKVVAQVVTAAPPPVVKPPEPDQQETPDVLVTVANFFKNYWIYGLVGFVLIAWAGTRVFTK